MTTDTHSHTSRVAGGINLTGPDCPRCEYRTHRAAFDGEVWARCVTDDCPRGWYRVE